MLETDIEGYLVQRVEAIGGMARKFVSPGHDKVPDRLILLPIGRRNGGDPDTDSIGYIVGQCVVFVETKKPGELATFPKNAHERGQLREHERLRALGFRVEVIDTKEGVDAFVEGLT